MPCDDARWFTVDVRPAWRVLIAAPQDAAGKPDDYALFLAEALAPHAIRVKGEAAFECDVIVDRRAGAKAARAVRRRVPARSARRCAERVWQKLQAYAAAGGGVGIFLGRNASPVESFNEPVAQELLPGKLRAAMAHRARRIWRPKTSSIRSWPSSRAGRRRALGIVSRVSPLAARTSWPKGAAVVLRYSNDQPALVERPRGQGPRADDDHADLRSGQPPRHLEPAADRRGALAVRDAGQRIARCTWSAAAASGSTTRRARPAVVQLGSQRAVSDLFADHAARRPDSHAGRREAERRRRHLHRTAGQLSRCRPAAASRGVDLGFSVNLPPQVSELDRVSDDDLQAVFGATEFRLARNRDEIDRSVSAGRVGQELFPYLILLLVVVLALRAGAVESVLSRTTTRRSTTSRAAQFAGTLDSAARTRPRQFRCTSP